MPKSPFSLTCGYQVTSYPFIPRTPGNLSERDKVIIDMTNTFGATAFFQLQQLWPNRHRNKTRNTAKSLARCGLLALHRLESPEYRMNVCTPGYFPGLDKVLRSLAFFQLYLRLREFNSNLSACLATHPLTGVVFMNDKEFPVVVVREGDQLPLLPYQLQDFERLVIVAESFDPAFGRIPCECRIALDEDLLNFSKPAGEIFFDAREVKVHARGTT
ncbi:MAG: hypothetical protein PWQ39_503 [Thermacetogenium sp.]|nr:hypothetical protein [Thermacetogenium sp.]